MSSYNICFSPTGGTRKVLDILNPDGETIDISKKIQMHLGPVDEAFVALPCYAGRCPMLALDNLGCISADGTKAVAVIVYGNRAYEDSLLELSDRLSEQGFRVYAAVAAIAEHSIIPEIAAARPDENDKALLKAYSYRIRKRLEASYPTGITIPGNRPYKIAKPSDMGIYADKSICTRCGICQQACPAGAISLADPCCTDKQLCINCMRCIKICPYHARGVDGEKRERIRDFLNQTAKERKEAELFPADKDGNPGQLP